MRCAAVLLFYKKRAYRVTPSSSKIPCYRFLLPHSRVLWLVKAERLKLRRRAEKGCWPKGWVAGGCILALRASSPLDPAWS